MRVHIKGVMIPFDHFLSLSIFVYLDDPGKDIMAKSL